MSPRAKAIVAAGAGAVSTLLGLFGGVVTASEPPLHPLHPNDVFATGVAKFSVLFVLLFITAAVSLYNPKKGKPVWFVVAISAFAVFLWSSWSYGRFTNQYSFEYPVGDSVKVFAAGTEYTTRADSILQADPGLTKADLVSGFGGMQYVARVWTEQSLNKASMGFKWRYIVILASLAAAIFSLAEGILGPGGKQGSTTPDTASEQDP